MQIKINSETRLPGDDPVAVHQLHLSRVSRSFAFCIARLEGRLREQVGLGYLLCRILDTVEDAPWSDGDKQQRAFREFGLFLKTMPTTAMLGEWRGLFPEPLPVGEDGLLNDAKRIFSEFHAWESAIRTKTAQSILSMSAGMSHFMRKKALVGRLTLSSSVAVNAYCFFVAGLVGEMLNAFLVNEISDLNERLFESVRFGLFLQKVNLLKDQLGDEQAGRFLVPARKDVLNSALKDAKVAFQYILALPVARRDFRLFCAWSLFLGLASLYSIHQPGFGKITRAQTELLLRDIEQIIDDEITLRHSFQMLHDRLIPIANQLPCSTTETSGFTDSTDAAELFALYRGQLSFSQFENVLKGDLG